MILASAQSSMFQAPFQKTLFTNVNTISNSEDKNKKIKFIPLSCSGGQSIFWKQQSNDYREEIPRKKYQKPKEKLITALFPGIDQLIPGIDTFSKEYFSKKKVNHMLQIIPFLYEKNKDKINFDIINMNFTEDKNISKPHPKKNNHLKRISNAPKIEKWEIGPIISNSINLEKKNVNDDEMNDETSCESAGEEKNEKETQHMEITTKETPHFYVNKAILELREIINKPKVIEEPTYNNNLNKENPKITPIPNIKNVSISQSDKNIFSGFGKIDTKTILKKC
ncbi:hypothetical protein TRFO_06915 [Tritrichomonas foetus]|uniref:Uncharacterized protein n=1 Tax=Tritrichomonas foetus TaxID=1144522 RepID=A0A1J4JUP3_9EUKA|nr:hypothetical protein TRFO_06915 [Tritrichomonas foetus]|eukprot:OHT02871.1 hypothetical protein TRFO_06915 [Tritrichomonas foetus]